MAKLREICEGRARILSSSESKISKKMKVFYNPIMKLNRDIAVTLLNSSRRKKLRIADPLAGTGVRTIRFLLELKKQAIETAESNDISQKACALIRKNLGLNNLRENKKIKIHNEDANLFLMKSKGFDYIEIDPFGSPNPYLECSIRRLARKGILAVTATDTSALCGTYPDACKRKYWALPMRNELMHETGLRILIRKVQLIGAQYERALSPVFSHSTAHYMRVYFSCDKSLKAVNEIIGKHAFFLYCSKCLNRKISWQNNERCAFCNNLFAFSGPLWTGNLWDQKITGNMLKAADKSNRELVKLLTTINEEAKCCSVGFYDTNKLCSRFRLKLKKRDLLIRKMMAEGIYASATHFNSSAIRSDLNLKSLVRVIKK